MQNRHNDVTVTGFLRKDGDAVYLESINGGRFFEDCLIWKGYQDHWCNKKVFARTLSQKDYQTGKRIIIMWPFREKNDAQFIELYYNERLIKYPASVMGHIAINVNNEIFNFSHLLNENEIITPEEYFYRPALGEFAPHPVTMRFNTDNPSRPYYDKFGRNFMRTIHVARIENADAERLRAYYKEQLRIIHGTIPNPAKPEKYKDFNIFKRSCTTIIRDGLKHIGFQKVKGVFPRDMFISAVWSFLRHKNPEEITLQLFTMPQLKVDEAEYSMLSPIMNIHNKVKNIIMKREGYSI